MIIIKKTCVSIKQKNNLTDKKINFLLKNIYFFIIQINKKLKKLFL